MSPSYVNFVVPAASLLAAVILYKLFRFTSLAPIHAFDAKSLVDSGSDAARDRYVFREKDEVAVQEMLDAGAVRVSKLMIYPIKSCRGTSVSETKYSPIGLENDRKWCIIDPSNHKILTARAIPKMVLVTPTVIADDDDPYGGRLEVTFPADSGCRSFSVPLRPTPGMLENWKRIEDLSVHSYTDIDGCITEPHPSSAESNDPDVCSKTLTQFLGRPVHLVYKGPRPRPAPPAWSNPVMRANVDYHDGYPLLVVSSESLEAVKLLVKEWCARRDSDELRKWDIDSIVIERFRPNIVFEGAIIPFAEDRWKEIDISAQTTSETGSFSLVSKCTRCMLPNIDPSTGIRDLAIPSKPLKAFRTGLDPSRMGDSCFGCNAVPAGCGTLHVGDVVSVKEWGLV